MLTVPTRSEIRTRPLESPRLLLAPLEPADGPDLWDAVDWDHGRACRFSMREKKTLNLVGVVGLETFAHPHQSVELGYWLRRESTGQGFMTEAARSVITWAFSRLNAHRVRVAAATDNHASLGVIRRLGFRFEGISREAERCHGRWLDHAVFALLVTDPRS